MRNLDRGIIIELERIPREKQRRLEEIWTEFDSIKPELLGYVFDILVKVLQIKNNGGIASEIKGLPRMADFAEIGEIISICIGHENNEFLSAYYRNIDIQVEEAIASNPVGNAVIKLMEMLENKTRSHVTIKEDCNSDWCSLLWKGTATELLADLESVAAELKINTHHKPWPNAPNTLSRRINEVKTNLREIGITIDRYFLDHKTKARGIKICKVLSEPSEPSERKNRAQVSSDMSDDIIDSRMIKPSEDKVSSDRLPENRAQSSMSDDKGDKDDILHTLPSTDYPTLCYYCDYKPDSKDHYERHVIFRHEHCLAYPNKAEIEKRELKPQGKDWEK